MPIQALACAGLILVLGMPADDAHAQADTTVAVQSDAALDTEAGRLFGKIMSPFCPGRTLANCPSPQAKELQIAIKAELRAGVTPDSIMQELIAVYGDEVRSVPPARGFNLLAWAVPIGFLLLGAVVLTRWLPARWRGAPVEPPSQAGTLDPEAEARLAAELTELESRR